jgi:hypothetical protein
MNLEDLSRLNTRSIHSAGPRYTPGTDSAAPNLEIKALELAIEGLACGQVFRRRAKELHDLLEKTSTDLRRTLTTPYSRSVRTPARLLKALTLLSQCPPSEGRQIVMRARAATRRLQSTNEKFSNTLYHAQEQRKDELKKATADSIATESFRPDPISEKLNIYTYEARKYERTTDEVLEFLVSAACDLQFKNAALLLGLWGTGKTHFLCDLATRRMEAGLASLLVLAKDFSPGQDIGQSLATFTGLAENFENLASALNALGEASGERAFLMIDGVNEGEHEVWRNGIGGLLTTARRFPYLGIIISCRQPFESLIFKSSDLKRLVKLSHKGFEDIEFDAQSEFFKYYDIPLPEIPLLAEEFSRPLTLKIMCEAFRDLPRKEQKKGFAGLASGQRGMTFVLERFVNRRARTLEEDFHLPARFCWTLIKGDDQIPDLKLSGIAPCMASLLKEYVGREECLEIIRERKLTRALHIATKLLKRLVSEGLLVEDVVWNSEDKGVPLKVVKLPYQRFSDHIIARSLLRQLDTSNASSIRKSLRNGPLNRLFAFSHPHYPHFEFPGWVEALIVEFPERTKKALPPDERELFYYLPQSAKDLNAYYKPFVGGLFWRSGESISSQTDRIVGTYIWMKDIDVAIGMIEAMLAVATKPEHPYNASRLYFNLAGIKLPERDRHWSEFLRKRSHSSTIERLIRWFETHTPRGLSDPSALNQMVLLSLILTTTDRTLRDRITRTLVILGGQFPVALFRHTVDSLGFNDPYVPERMLAACYGVAMSLSGGLKTSSFTKALCKLAGILAKELFLPGGNHHTTHVLIREYALGIIDLARKGDQRCISDGDVKYLIHPFKAVRNPFPRDKTVKETDCEAVRDAIHMDFGNYTIGHLVRDRGNYDMDHLGYKEIRRKIEWRIANLGYRSNDFQVIDRIIGSDNWNRNSSSEGKVDRYGKKYSWIAYFEMYGYLQKKGLLPHGWQSERCSDCDIDPSFPDSPQQWLPELRPLFTIPYEDPVRWIKDGPVPDYADLLQPRSVSGIDGPWVLLNGFINESSNSDPREIFTFLRGLFIPVKALQRIRVEFEARPYPGNQSIPEVGQDYYTFGGEVPWSYRYGTYLRTQGGKAKRHLEEMYEQHKPNQVKKANIDTQREALLDAIRSDFRNISPERLEEDLKPPALTVNSTETDHRTDNHNDYYETEYIKIPGVMIEVPVHRWSWESHHSSLNQISGIHLPAPALCEALQLRRRGRAWDLYDSENKVASLYREFKAGPINHRSHLVYLRADLLNRYLSIVKQRFIWINWGERSFHYEEQNKVAGLLHDEWQKYSHIHKKLIVR